MGFSLSPGVITREIDLTTGVPAVSTREGCFVGQYNWGPVEQPVYIGSEEELVNLFHKPDSTNYIDFFTAANFLSYSGSLWVTRVIDDSAKNATSGSVAAYTEISSGLSAIIDGNATPLIFSNNDIYTQNGVDTTRIWADTLTGFVVGNKIEFTRTSRMTAGYEISINGAVCDTNDATDNTITDRAASPTGRYIIGYVEAADEIVDLGVATNDVLYIRTSGYSSTYDANGGYIKVVVNEVISLESGQTVLITLKSADIINASNQQINGIIGAISFSGSGFYDNIFLEKSTTDQYEVYSTNTTGSPDYVYVIGSVPQGYVYKFGTNKAYETSDPVTTTLVKNRDYFEDNFDTLSASSVGDIIAKYPGTKGNSLRVSFCPSATAYAGDVTVTSIANNKVYGTFTSLYPSTDDDIEDNGTYNGDGTDDGERKFVYQGEVKTILGGNTSTIILSSSFNKTITSPSGTQIVWEYWNYFDNAPGTSDTATEIGASNDEIHAIVVDEDGLFTGTPGTVLERFEGLSKATNAKKNGLSNYYMDVINNNSAYVWVVRHPGTNNTNWGTDAAIGTEFGGDNTATSHSLNQGYDGGVISTADRINGYDEFLNESEYDISFILTGNSNATLNNYLVSNIAEVRQDCIVFISPQLTDVLNVYDRTQAQNCITYKNTMNFSSSYAVMDCNWKYQYDKYNDAYRWLPLNGDIAGLVAAADLDFDPWMSPGGLTRGRIRNVIKLAFNPSKSQMDLLYKNNINPVILRKDSGAVLWGDKTMLNKDSVFNGINVRRLFIVLRKAIAKMSENFLFELNNEFTQTRFVNLVKPYLLRVKAKGGIEDYRVVCDETNNTAEVRNNKQFIGDIYIIPTKSINFIRLNFVAVRSGVDFNEIVGRI